MAGENRQVRARLAALLGEWGEAMEFCVREAQADGSVRRDLDPATLAAFLLNSWEGALLRAKVDRNNSALEVFRRAASALLSR